MTDGATRLDSTLAGRLEENVPQIMMCLGVLDGGSGELGFIWGHVTRARMVYSHDLLSGVILHSNLSMWAG